MKFARVLCLFSVLGVVIAGSVGLSGCSFIASSNENAVAATVDGTAITEAELNKQLDVLKNAFDAKAKAGVSNDAAAFSAVKSKYISSAENKFDKADADELKAWAAIQKSGLSSVREEKKPKEQKVKIEQEWQ